MAWVGVNALSSWLYAPQASVSFVHVFRIGLLALVFLTVANLPLRRASDWMRGFRIWLSLGLLVLTYGLLVWIVASYLDIWMPGAFYEAIVGGPGIQSTQLEICLKAMTLGFLVMLIAYQVTDGTWLAVFWIHTGLMVNGIYCVREEQRRAAEPGQGQAS